MPPRKKRAPATHARTGPSGFALPIGLASVGDRTDLPLDPVRGEHLARFNLTEEHVTLLRSLRWGRTWYHVDGPLPQEGDTPYVGFGHTRPFGNSDVEMDIATILGWFPEDDYAAWEALEEVLTMRARALMAELCDAMQIVMSLATFDPGTYILVALGGFGRAMWFPASSVGPEPPEAQRARRQRARDATEMAQRRAAAQRDPKQAQRNAFLAKLGIT